MGEGPDINVDNNLKELASLMDRGALIQLPMGHFGGGGTAGAFVRCRWLFVGELGVCPTVRVCIATLVPTMAGSRVSVCLQALGDRAFHADRGDC